ncbi:MAG: hypothetical protein QOD76_1990, partial [Solirubrobacteraceae bacterium]|nr:hypothetical protein [Solirubrobacteraceae bacterium]
MGVLENVPIGKLSFERFETVLDPDRYRQVREAV